MIGKLPSIFLIAVLSFLILLLWLVSIVSVFLDTKKRGLDEQSRMTWLAVTALLPLVGYLAYLFLRWLPPWPHHKPVVNIPFAPQRATLLQPPEQPAEPRLDTIAGRDVLQSTRPGQDVSPLATPPTPPSFPLVEPRSLLLAVANGPYQGTKFSLVDLPVSIGRGSSVTIKLDQDLSVSRRHAEIYLQEGKLRLRDLESSHGTRLNGQPVRDSALNPGDRISVGTTDLVVQGAGERRPL